MAALDFTIPWPFTCYGHALELPNCVTGDISYEELHWYYVAPNANVAELNQQIAMRAQEMKKQTERILADPILASV